MRNSIEILRSIYFTENDFSTIKDFEIEFTDKQKEFIGEFKKVYELGFNQLEKFINKLADEGNELSPWEIEYFVNQLFNGPLAKYVAILSKDKKYFSEIPDILGILGNTEITDVNVSLVYEAPIPTGSPVGIFNKCPKFIQDNIITGTNITEKVFRANLFAAISNDNTLPIADKTPGQRENNESSGDWSTRSNGNLLMKDSYYLVKTLNIKNKIFDKIKELLGDDQYLIYEDKKTYNPFDSEKNTSFSKAFVVEREEVEIVEYINDDTETLSQTLILDLFGNQFETDLRRDYFENITKRKKIELSVEEPEDTKDYFLNRTLGQIDP